MKYWIDVENGEYGMVADTTELPGLEICGEGPLGPLQTERIAARAREESGVLVMEALETFQVVFAALESAMGMNFIHSPVAPTCRADGSTVVEEMNSPVIAKAGTLGRIGHEAIAA